MTSESPMIAVSDLVKKYAAHTAVAGVSFTVRKGEIVGLLGPNGAGKSTILRILAGFLTATSGTVRVAGFDVFEESLAVRRRIGYMPENNPLPPEMRVREYLKFRALLKGIPRNKISRALDQALEQCAITGVSRKIIGQLSKGFRQRVGLADALIHEPELVILDEPTIGLDPNQIRAVRRLVKTLAGRHTILLSTHILPEVEMTCNRVLILHEGKLLAADSTENLLERGNGDDQVVAEIAGPLLEIEECWKSNRAIRDFNIAPADGRFYRCALTPSNGADLRPLIFDAARAHGWTLRELTRARHSLEDVFVQVIREEIDEEEAF